MSTRCAILAAALGAAALATPSLAQASAVKYADLDLGTSSGQAQLERRIDQAAREACGLDAQRSGTRLGSSEAKKCYTETLASVHKQVAETIAKSSGSVG
jgi:UrcA family protein